MYPERASGRAIKKQREKINGIDRSRAQNSALLLTVGARCGKWKVAVWKFEYRNGIGENRSALLGVP